MKGLVHFADPNMGVLEDSDFNCTSTSTKNQCHVTRNRLEVQLVTVSEACCQLPYALVLTQNL